MLQCMLRTRFLNRRTTSSYSQSQPSGAQPSYFLPRRARHSCPCALLVRNHVPPQFFSTKAPPQNDPQGIAARLSAYLAGICKTLRNNRANGRRDTRPRTPPVSPPPKLALAKARPTAEIQFLEMDERPSPRVFLAGWICSFQRQLVKYRVRDPVHPEPGGASPKDRF